MIILNEQQKAAIRKEKELLMESISIKEIEYHASTIHKILDTAERVHSQTEKRFTDTQLRLFDKYKIKMLNAVDIEEIDYYMEELIKLIDDSKMN